MIGTHPYVLDWYGYPAAHQLVLTFDDGPDPRNTPKILNILGREHVPATFFVVGQNVARNPAIVNREIREGHVVGNHTLTHASSGHGSVLDREELIADDRIIRATAGYATRLYRMPYGDPDDNPFVVLEAQQLGYVTVDLDLDTHDWQYTPAQNIPLPKLDGKGHVVLMHDGGADRAATIRLLPRLIAEAKAAGYTFTTAASLVPAEYVPRHVTPSVADRFTWYSAWAILVLPGDLVTWLFWFGVGSLTLMSLNYLVLALVNQHRQSRRTWPQVPGTPVLMTVVLPAYNEEKILAKTLAALAKTDYPRFEVVAVDDGSSDDTWGVLTDFASVWPRLRVFRQETNGGKAAAMNCAIAQARGEVIVTLDGDTVFEPQTIGMLARHFADPRIGVVAGQVKVGNRRNLLTAWQSLEYISGIGVTRMAEGLVGAITVAPGACAAWRKRAIEEAGGYSSMVHGGRLRPDADHAAPRVQGHAGQRGRRLDRGADDGPRSGQAAAALDLRDPAGLQAPPRDGAAAALRSTRHGGPAVRAPVDHYPAGLHAADLHGRRASPRVGPLAARGGVRRVHCRYSPGHVDRGDPHGAGTPVAFASRSRLPADLRTAASVRAVPVAPDGGQGQGGGLVPCPAYQYRKEAAGRAFPAVRAPGAGLIRGIRRRFS